jgi:hypothetical protein
MATWMFACLGNRNLKFQPDLAKAEEKYEINQIPESVYAFPDGTDSIKDGKRMPNFRNRCAWLLEQFKDGHLTDEHFDINIILNTLIDSAPSPNQLVLIASDQHDARHNHSDTIYEAELIKLLLETQAYGYEGAVTIETYSANPADIDITYPFIRDQILKGQNDYLNNIKLEATVYFVDAGGTPQLKNATRDLLRYYFPQTQVKYTADGKPNTDVKLHFANRYTILRAVERFINHYEYAGALRLLDQIDPDTGGLQELKQGLRVASARFQLDELWLNVLAKDENMNDEWKVWTDRNQQKHNFPLADEGISNLNLGRLFDLSSVLQVCFDKKQEFTLGIALWYRMGEAIGQFMAEARGANVNFKNSKSRNDYVNQYLEEYNRMAAYNVQILYYGIASMLVVANTEANTDKTKALTQLFMSHCSAFRNNNNGLDFLRNGSYLAHSTLAISKMKINEIIPDFFSDGLAQYYDLLNLPQTNVFDQLNDELRRVLRTL